MNEWIPKAQHPAETMTTAAKVAASLARAAPPGAVYAAMATLYTALAEASRTSITADYPECPNCGEGCGGHDAVWSHDECGWLDECTCPIRHFIAAAEALIETQGDILLDEADDSEPERREREWEAASRAALQRAIGPYRMQAVDWAKVERAASGLHLAEEGAVHALTGLAHAATDVAEEITHPSEIQDERCPFRYSSLAGEFEAATIAMADLAAQRNHVRPSR